MCAALVKLPGEYKVHTAPLAVALAVALANLVDKAAHLARQVRVTFSFLFVMTCFFSRFCVDVCYVWLHTGCMIVPPTWRGLYVLVR